MAVVPSLRSGSAPAISPSTDTVISLTQSSVEGVPLLRVNRPRNLRPSLDSASPTLEVQSSHYSQTNVDARSLHVGATPEQVMGVVHEVASETERRHLNVLGEVQARHEHDRNSITSEAIAQLEHQRLRYEGQLTELGLRPEQETSRRATAERLVNSLQQEAQSYQHGADAKFAQMSETIQSLSHELQQLRSHLQRKARRSLPTPAVQWYTRQRQVTRYFVEITCLD